MGSSPSSRRVDQLTHQLIKPITLTDLDGPPLQFAEVLTHRVYQSCFLLGFSELLVSLLHSPRVIPYAPEHLKTP